MTYRYVLRFIRYNKTEKITVEAWPRKKELATPQELRKPSFIIGTLTGKRTSMAYYLTRELVSKYGAIKTKRGFIIRFPDNSIDAILDAYHIGLVLATISNASTEVEAENALRYIERCTPEEIWFWTSKLLGIIRKSIPAQNVVRALTILAGS